MKSPRDLSGRDLADALCGVGRTLKLVKPEVISFFKPSNQGINEFQFRLTSHFGLGH
jgi:hypothetical protein